MNFPSGFAPTRELLGKPVPHLYASWDRKPYPLEEKKT
jgi:hypothetical protein